MGTTDLARAADRVADVSARGHDVVNLWREVADILAPVVPSFQGPCCFTLDPATLLMTSHFNPSLNYPLPQEMLRGEYAGEDAHDLASVARSRIGVSTLHDATGGDLAGSARWRANMELGGDQELIVATRDRTGAAWGCLTLYREPGAPIFNRREIGFLAAAAPLIAEGLQRALLIGEAQTASEPRGPGLLVLSADLDTVSATPGTEEWVAELPGGDNDGLPPSVVAVAMHALGSTRGVGPAGEAALARVRTRSGRWVVLHGAILSGGSAEGVAVIIEPAHPARIAPLLMAAYGLTERESDVARLVLTGESTSAIGERLFVSPHTVQEHLKRIFDKTGVRSRRDLIGKVFFAHYEPRLRDNEQRVLDHRPLLGGPMNE